MQGLQDGSIDDGLIIFFSEKTAFSVTANNVPTYDYQKLKIKKIKGEVILRLTSCGFAGALLQQQ
jgi:hypothetical protein